MCWQIGLCCGDCGNVELERGSCCEDIDGGRGDSAWHTG